MSLRLKKTAERQNKKEERETLSNPFFVACISAGGEKLIVGVESAEISLLVCVEVIWKRLSRDVVCADAQEQ
jgi:hypothetical protein